MKKQIKADSKSADASIIIHAIERRVRTAGHITKKDAQRFLKAMSWICGMPLPLEGLARAIQVLRAKKRRGL